MIARRRFAGLAVLMPALAAAVLAPPSPARAGDGLEPYAPLLVELPGWKAGKLGGLAMQDGGSRIVVAQRGYERGEIHETGAQTISRARADGLRAKTRAAPDTPVFELNVVRGISRKQIVLTIFRSRLRARPITRGI